MDLGINIGLSKDRRIDSICWKTSPQRYHVMRLVGDISWQESDQLDNFDRRSKFLEISLTTYIENKQYTEL